MNDEFNDYFEKVNKPEPEPQETPEEREERLLQESVIEKRVNRKRLIAVGLVLVVAIGLAVFIHLRWGSPYKQSQVHCVITEVANEGDLFKTYECKAYSREFLVDTMHVLTTDFAFSIRSDSLARTAMRLKGQRVTVAYQEYHGRLPWRGETTRFATAITPVDSVR